MGAREDYFEKSPFMNKDYPIIHNLFFKVNQCGTNHSFSPLAHTVLEKLQITGIKLQGQNEIQHNRVTSAIRTQPVARDSNENRNRGAIASSTAEKLSEILCNIRKTKEKTAFDAIVQGKFRQKMKRVIRARSVEGSSDSDDEFRPVAKQKREHNIIDDSDVEMKEIPLPTESDTAVNQADNSIQQAQDKVSVELEDDDDDDYYSLPLFGQFIKAKSEKLQPAFTADENGPSTTDREKPTVSDLQNSNKKNNARMQTSDSITARANRKAMSSQVAGPSHANVNSASRTESVLSISQAPSSVRATSNQTSDSRFTKNKTRSPPRNKKNISSSTMNKLKMFAITSTPVPETSSTNGMPSSSGNESRLQTATPETVKNGTARESVINTASENKSHSEISASRSAATPAFASGGFVGSFGLFTVDHDDLSILDDI